MDEYQDRVLASWLGQIVGNIYGLSYEFRFLEAPGPDEFPYGYGETLERVRELGGAFSDDDTDIEYLSLLQMEKYGTEPSYRNLAEAWKYHIRDRIWAANRVALTLMHHGYWPPATGDSLNNPRWFEIDPQLVNEIWAVTAPGMVDYAVGKTEWSARITSDSFGFEPAKFYAAMYAEAFFTNKIDQLIRVGLESLPAESRFASAVRQMQELYRRHPTDWRAARAVLYNRYYLNQPYNRHGWAPIDATLNGAAAVLALLYGEGDIQQTLDLACAMGFDADNQAATLTGLLALSQGSDSIPNDLLFPLPELNWQEPFNDRYINVTRFDMPNAGLSDLARRLAEQGKKVILEQGGRIVTHNGMEILQIDSNARFIPPFEILPPPRTLTTVGSEIEVPVYSSTRIRDGSVSVSGNLPPGIEFEGSSFRGKAEMEGHFVATLTLTDGVQEEAIEAIFDVRSENLAVSASEILHNDLSGDLERLRDGLTKDPPFVSTTRDHPFTQWYGFKWSNPVTISRVGFHAGFPNEEWGWLKKPRVEYLDAYGEWTDVSNQQISPPFPEGDSKYLQPGWVVFDFQFDSIRTNAVRLVGEAGGHPVDQTPAFGSIVSEISIHAR